MPHKETQQGALEFAGAEVRGGELICEPQMSSPGCHLFSLAPGFPPLEPEGVTSLMGPRPHGQRGKGNTGAQTQQACGRHFHPSSSPVHQPWPWWIRKAGSAGPFTSVSRPTRPLQVSRSQVDAQRTQRSKVGLPTQLPGNPPCPLCRGLSSRCPL